MANKRRATRDPQANLPAPTVPDLVPDVPGAAHNNVVSYPKTFQPLRVEFPQWPFSDPSEDAPETVFLYRRQELLEQKRWTQPVKPDELFILMSHLYLQEGYHQLHYKVEAFDGSVIESSSLTLYVDKTPPQLNLSDDRLQFPQQIIDEGVTFTYLENNGDQLVGTVPAYLGAEPGDTLRWFWSATSDGTQWSDSKVLGPGDVEPLDGQTAGPRASKPIAVVFPGQVIRDVGEGVVYARYEVQDRAGTPLQRSQVRSLTSHTWPDPATFPPPHIKEARGDEHSSTLAPRDGVNGLKLVVPDSARLKPGEHFHVYWGTPASVGAFNTATPVTPGAREYPIPKAHIAPYVLKQVPVYYEIFRGSTKVNDSLRHQVTVTTLTGLPFVQCAKIISGELNLRTLGNSAEFTLDGWLLRDTTQFVNAWIEAPERGNESNTIRIGIADAVPVPTEAGRMSVGTVSNASLQRAALNRQFKVLVEVSFDAKTSWLAFPNVTATLVDR